MVSTNDEAAISEKLSNWKTVGIPSNACLGKLIEMNNYSSARVALDIVLKHGNLSWDEANHVYEQIVASSAEVNDRYDTMLTRVQARNEKPIKVTPPF